MTKIQYHPIINSFLEILSFFSPSEVSNLMTNIYMVFIVYNILLHKRTHFTYNSPSVDVKTKAEKGS